MIDISKPSLGLEEIKAIEAVLKSGAISQGNKVSEFEEEFAAFIGIKHAVAVSSGTAALHVALLAHGVGDGNEVITTPFTFISTANSIKMTGARPVFVDIEEETFNIDPDRIVEEITPRTKAIMPVHLYGLPCDMNRIMKIVEDNGLIVIEDACQAHGAEYKGKKVGSYCTGCFSFYATKNMTTGEGGMITTNDDIIAHKARMIRNHGQESRYYQELLGYNYRMTDLMAAIGLCQLERIQELNNKRIQNAKTWTDKLGEIKGLLTPRVRPDLKHVFHQYTVRVTEDFTMSRSDLQEKLRHKGITTEIYYPLPIHKQPFYMRLGYNDYLPNSEKASKEVLSLPIHPLLTTVEIEFMATTLTALGRPESEKNFSN